MLWVEVPRMDGKSIYQVLSIYNNNFYCRLALGDEVVDRGSYAQQQRSSSTSLSSRSHQSQDDQNNETLQHHEEMM
jgi:hypothetical protein